MQFEDSRKQNMASSSWHNRPLIPMALLALMRSMMIWWFTPAYSDFTMHSLPFARLSELGLYPMVHYWIEYPPLFPYLCIAVYKLISTVLTPGTFAFVAVFGGAMQEIVLCFELGALWLAFRLVEKETGHETATGLIWIYSLLFSPVFAMSGYFDHIAVFFLILPLYLAARGRDLSAGLAVGAGAMVKLLPLLALPACLKCVTGTRSRCAMLAACALACLACVLPFAVMNPHVLATSARVMFGRGAWQSPWALMEGYAGFGSVAPSKEHWKRLEQTDLLIPGGAATVLKIRNTDWSPDPRFEDAKKMEIISRFTDDLFFIRKSPPGMQIVYAAAGVVFLALLAFAYVKTAAGRNPLPLAGFTALAFLLYAKGWSPQFVAYAIPLLLFASPDVAGFSCLAALCAATFLEMPVWVIYTSGRPPLAILIIAARTAALAIGAFHLARVAARRDLTIPR